MLKQSKDFILNSMHEMMFQVVVDVFFYFDCCRRMERKEISNII